MKHLKKIYVYYSYMLIFSACTYSINMIHTSGMASDVVDETQSAKPDISPTVTIPMIPGV